MVVAQGSRCDCQLFSGDWRRQQPQPRNLAEPTAFYELRVDLNLQFGEGPIPSPGPGLDLNAIQMTFTVSAGFGEHYNVYTYQAGQYWDGVRDSKSSAITHQHWLRGGWH